MARSKDDHGELIAFSAQTSFKPPKGLGEIRDKTMICTHCKRSRYEASDCFQLVRYPNL